jgi:orotidine-5'-phosphate decarboxylase
MITTTTTHLKTHPHRRIIVALDVPTLEQALRLVHQLHTHVGGFKVGLELCTAVGVPHVVKTIGEAGGLVFLDLKFKDIPNTVAGAVRAIGANCEHYVHMLTIHTDGGRAMLQAAVDAARAAYPPLHPQQAIPRPLLLGVTLLTSIDDDSLHHELGVERSVSAHVRHLALLAQQTGLDGVIASPQEAASIKDACGDDFLVVTPGVRPTWAASGDQRRVTTPAEAVRAGADFLVIGRPITAAPGADGGPVAAAIRIAQEIQQSQDTE